MLQTAARGQTEELLLLLLEVWDCFVQRLLIVTGCRLGIQRIYVEDVREVWGVRGEAADCKERTETRED